MESTSEPRAAEQPVSNAADCSGGERMTIVFAVKDRSAMTPFYESHRSGKPMFGVVPTILAWGDAVTVPGEIARAVSELDPHAIDDRAVKELIEVADKWNSM